MFDTVVIQGHGTWSRVYSRGNKTETGKFDDTTSIEDKQKVVDGIRRDTFWASHLSHVTHSSGEGVQFMLGTVELFLRE